MIRNSDRNIIFTSLYESPAGVLRLGALGGRICLCDWETSRRRAGNDRRIERILRAEFCEGTSPVIGMPPGVEKATVIEKGLVIGKSPVIEMPPMVDKAPIKMAQTSEMASVIEKATKIEKMPEIEKSPVIEKAKKELDEYFAGKRRTFDVPLLFAGTDFQKRVWNELLKIPYGETVSYGEMARRIGMPEAVRAVANADGANAISIFAPCHRVIGSDGSLTGYAGGLDAKRLLLDLEAQNSALSAVK